MAEWSLQHTFTPMTADEPDLAAWFKGKDYDVTIQRQALDGVVAWVKKEYGAKAALKRTPTGTGMGLLELSLPLTKENHPIAYPALSEGIQRLIHATSFPHRWENFDRKTVGVEYDARSAFVGCCRLAPVYRSELLHDDVDEYVPHMPARYLVDVTVPRSWAHIGLVPAEHVIGEKYRRYPSAPGDSWQVWLDGMEVNLLERYAWPYHIRKRLIFTESKVHPGNEPLRKWIEPFVSMLEKIEKHPKWGNIDIHAIRHCIRAMALQTIGRFHYTGGDEIFDIDPDTGKVSVTIAPKLNNYTQRFHQPHWSAHVWSKNRVHVTQQALLVPREHVLRIHGDSVALAVDPGWQDDGKVGSFRKKVA